MVVLNTDAYKAIKELPDSSVDLVITDPPYDLEKGAGDFRKHRKHYEEISDISNGFDYSMLDELVRVMKYINIYIFCSKNQLMELMEYFVKQHGCKWELISWHKTNPIPVCNNTYLHDTEFCLFFREKAAKVYGSYHTKRTYYVSSVNKKDKKLYKHPTIKPLELIDNFVNNSSLKGQTVLDPFMGSGTTGVAAAANDRKFIGYELNEEYFNVAKDRIENTLQKE